MKLEVTWKSSPDFYLNQEISKKARIINDEAGTGIPKESSNSQ